MSINPAIYSEAADDFSCEKIISLDNSIRFVGMASIEGHLLDLKYRDGISPLLSNEMLKNTVRKTASRHISRCEDVGDMGMPLYTNFI